MGAPPFAAAGVLLALAAAPQQGFDERLDHAGEVGVRLQLVGEYLNLLSTSAASGSFSAFGGGIEAGPTTWFDDEGDELSLRARWIPRGIQKCEAGTCAYQDVLSFLAGVRKLVGRDELKTFVDADLVLSAITGWFGGLHLGAGAMWDPNRHLGAFASIGVVGEIGASFRFRFEANVGVQVRFDVGP